MISFDKSGEKFAACCKDISAVRTLVTFPNSRKTCHGFHGYSRAIEPGKSHRHSNNSTQKISQPFPLVRTISSPCYPCALWRSQFINFAARHSSMLKDSRNPSCPEEPPHASAKSCGGGLLPPCCSPKSRPESSRFQVFRGAPVCRFCLRGLCSSRTNSECANSLAAYADGKCFANSLRLRE